MRLSTFETTADSVTAGYHCPCGCRPSVTHRRGGDLARSDCCCGNVFLLGPDADLALVPRVGYQAHAEARVAGWGVPVTAAWLIGPSTHPASDATETEAGHHHHLEASPAVTDPVCGMHVDPADARERGLHHHYREADYYFCGKGCYLDFGDDPERILAPGYLPSM